MGVAIIIVEVEVQYREGEDHLRGHFCHLISRARPDPLGGGNGRLGGGHYTECR